MKIFQNRKEMVKSLITKKSVCVELGVLKGDFSEYILSLNPQELYLIDIWESPDIVSGDHDGLNVTHYDGPSLFQFVKDRFAHKSNVFVEKRHSLNFLADYLNFFDFIYIDTVHDKSTFDELQAAHKSCKSGGYICGHDMAVNENICNLNYKFEVEACLHKFCYFFDYDLHSLALDGCISFCIQKK